MKDLNKLSEAFEFANQVHKDQVRTGSGAPYICHIIQVCGLVLEYGGSVDDAKGALFHDIFEDHGHKFKPEDVALKFGQKCVDIALECSDCVVTKENEKKAPWHERKTKYLESISAKSNSAKLVTCADKIHNMRTTISDYNLMGKEVWNKFNASEADTKWYYNAIYEELKSSGFDNRIMYEFKNTVDKLTEL